MKPKDKNSLIEEIQSAVANYCYDHDDQDFEITLSVRAEDGWAKVEDTEEVKNENKEMVLIRSQT